ncbi:MAG: sugar transferase, partial [Desulfatitalea sp.]|nr:sugar transferase [Desulfatitalea sp.]
MGKQFFDLVLTVPALVAASPFIVLIAGLVRLKMGRPIFFRQVRPG